MDYQKFLHAAALLEHDRQALDREMRALHESAQNSTKTGDINAAIEALRELLALDDKADDVWHDYGLLLQRQHQYLEASEALLRSIMLDKANAQKHYDFGTGLERLENPSSILHQYVQILGLPAVAADLSDPPNLSIDSVQQELERFVQATGEEHVGVVDALMNLGYLLLAQHDLQQAAEAYRRALAIEPGSVAVAENLATALQLQGKEWEAALVRGKSYYHTHRFGDAIREIQYGLENGEGSLEDYNRLAWSFYYLHRYSEAVEVCRNGTELYPGARSLYRVWVLSLEQLSQVDEAVHVAEHAATMLDDPLFMFHERNLMLPVLYQEQSEIKLHRKRYEDGLARLMERAQNATEKELQHLSNGIVSNFYLGYQGDNIVDLQQTYGRISQRFMYSAYGEYCTPRKMPAIGDGGRIRIGYVSRHLRQHTVARLFLGWLQLHDRTRFEVYTYHTGYMEDFLSSQFEAASDHYHHIDAEIDEIARKIQDDDLHILTFLDIGMDSHTTRLANLRLAPIHCAAWGHPISTGLSTIDYFLSSDLMEPDNADAHYTETLIRLPGISVSVPPPYLPTPPKKPEEFGLPSDGVLYFAGQSPFKYLPQHDLVFPGIASQVPEALFVFVSSHVPEITLMLRNRLLKAFDQAGLDGRKHITFHKPLSPLNYVELMRVCDVFLDSIGWSGGMTTLEAVGCTLPIVTYPGELMRGRHSYGILSQLGMRETIASSLEQYVDIAVRLGKEPEWRLNISRQLAATQERLFYDRAGLDALEKFYEWAVEHHTPS